MNYKDAYDAAIRQANACLRSTDNAYRVVPSLDEASRSGEVRVLAPFADTEMTRVNVKAAGDKSTDVRIVVWGKGTGRGGAARHEGRRVLQPGVLQFLHAARSAAADARAEEIVGRGRFSRRRAGGG